MSDTPEPERGVNVDNPHSMLKAIPEWQEISSVHSGDSNERVVSDSSISDMCQDESTKARGAADHANSTSGTAEDVEQVAKGERQRRRSGREHAESAPPFGMSWRFKLPDDRYRPPETEEEWNAFYQEYTTGDNVNHSERFLIVTPPDDQVTSPLSGSPMIPPTGKMSSIGRDSDYGFGDVAHRSSSSGQLASAFVNPRRSSSSSHPHTTAGTSRSSLDYTPDARNATSRENSGIVSPFPFGLVSPLMETPQAVTPSSRDNQDPEIPNIDVGGYEGGSSKYQSGMTVSSSQRMNQDQREPSPDWSSPAAQQQRDLARMLGQSSAKMIHRPSSPDSEEETQAPSPALSDVTKRLAHLSDLGGDVEEPQKDDSWNAMPSDVARAEADSRDSGLIGSEDEQKIRIGGQTMPDRNLSPSGEALQTIPLTAPLDNSPQASKGTSQNPDPVPSSPTSQPHLRTSVAGPSSDSRTQLLPHKESNPPPFKASLPLLVEEETNEAGTPIFANTRPFDTSEGLTRQRSDYTANLRPTEKPSQTVSARHRLDSEASEDARRYDVDARQRSEALRMAAVWREKGHLTAPKQPPADVHRRLKAIRKLGLDRPGEDIHRTALDRYVRLAKAICETKMAMITILGENSQICPSRIGSDIVEAEYDLGLCTHTALSPDRCMSIPDASSDWRFKNHPWIASGNIRAYCGAPLTMNSGRNKVTIGSLCVADDKPRPDFNEDIELALQDLAACIAGELELLYVHEDQKFQQILHETSVQFLRDCLQVQQIPGMRRKKSKGKTRPRGSDSDSETDGYGIVHLTDKAQHDRVNLYDETCRIIGDTLNATACLIVDTTCFHVFYPTSADKTSSNGSRREQTGSRTTGTATTRPSSISSRSSHLMSSRAPTGRAEEKRARNLQYENVDRYHPQVRFLPGKRRRNEQQAAVDAATKVGFPIDNHQERKVTEKHDTIAQVPLLGYWADIDGLEFDFTSTTAKDALTAFISVNLQSRRFWFERDDSEDLAESMNAIMPEATSTSLSMPIFDYRGQCAFIFIACWSDLYYSYDQSILAFVETMCGTLMASSLRNRLSAVDEAQRAFARMANHELKTPMHQMSNYIEEMLCLLEESKEQHSSVPTEVLQELEKYATGAQTSSRRMRHLLDAVTNYLEIGGEFGEKRGSDGDESVMNVDELLTIAMEDARKRETKNRQLAGDNTMDQIELMIEIVPRETGTWLLTRDVNPLQSAIQQLLLNACQATRTGYISLVCEDVSRKDSVPEGYEASLPTSIISIRITDTGNGMPQEFADHKIFQPYAKWDHSTPGAGLGVTLAHRTIDLMGGTLAFKTQPNVGTTALLEVPLRIKNEDVGSDSHELHFRPVDCKICLIGFDRHAHTGIQQIGHTLRNQIKAINVTLGNISDSDIFVIEAGYNVKAEFADIKNVAAQRDIRLIRLGHSSMYNSNPREHFLNGDEDLPVEWLFRPLYPRLLRRIAMIPSDDAGRALLHQHDLSHNERDADSHLRWAQHREKDGNFANVNDQDFAAEDGKEENNQAILTRVPSPDAPIPDSRRSSNATSQKINARDLRVLVVEDDLINRKLLCGKLAKMKIQSFQAENGQVAIDVYRQHLPQVVLMDIEMPVKTGFEASIGIRAYEKEANLQPCLIWAVTAKSDDVSKVYGMESCGIDKWFTKPLKLSKLENIIRAKFDITV